MKQLMLAFAIALICNDVCADTNVSDAWVRATVPSQGTTGAFLTLIDDADGMLRSASSPVAGVTELHEMKMEGDVMKMQAVPGIPITAGKPLALKPGGYHIMLMKLKRQLKPGETVPIALSIEGKDGKRRTVELQAPVKGLDAAPAGHDAKHR